MYAPRAGRAENPCCEISSCRVREQHVDAAMVPGQTCVRAVLACAERMTVASRAAIVFPSLESRRRRTCARVMDAPECLRRGAVGALGAVPGTLAAHPFDLLKMHQQVRAATLSEAIRHVSAGKQGPELAAAFYRGAGAGVAHARADVPLE